MVCYLAFVCLHGIWGHRRSFYALYLWVIVLQSRGGGIVSPSQYPRDNSNGWDRVRQLSQDAMGSTKASVPMVARMVAKGPQTKMAAPF